MSSQNDTLEICINLKEYEKVADKTLNKNFFISRNLPKDVSHIIDTLKLVPYHYELENLSTYSIPIFKLKKDIDSFSCDKNIIDYIDFTNNYYKQFINIEFEGKLISITSREKKDRSKPIKTSSRLYAIFAVP